jgi:acyl-CoA thioester hydrolase
MTLHEHDVVVRWRDTDALGHVNHAVLLTYLEEGRDRFFECWLEGDAMYVVVRVELDLLREVKLVEPRRVTVVVESVDLGRTSIKTTEVIVLPSGEPAARAHVVCVRWDAGARAPMALSDEERSRLDAMGDRRRLGRGVPPRMSVCVCARPRS